jgi:radical SAM protein with 4Fe4S-binding SPASM domain
MPDPATQRYLELRHRLRARASVEPLPLVTTLELTARCNLSCAHCYINLPAEDPEARARELSTAEVLRILDELAAEGCLWLLLTGGEPLLRPDFREIHAHAKRRGLLVTLNTNGVAITASLAEFLAEWPPLLVEISLYGATAATYERVTRSPGSFQRCLDGIELLRARGIPVGLKSVCTTDNQHELEAMAAYARARDLEFRFDSEIMCRLDGDRAPTRLRLQPEEAVARDRSDAGRWQAWIDRARSAGGPAPRVPAAAAGERNGCGAGRFTAHVDAFGRLSACMTARTPSYDLRHGSVREGWRDFMPGAVAQLWPSSWPCATCDVAAVCNRCPSWSELECGNRERPAEYLCTMARLRASAITRDRRNEELP